MGKIQKLDWGSIEWIFEPQAGSQDSMRVGISHMPPGAVQPRHIHSGDEQLMYFLSGRGTQSIGDQESPIEPGTICHISPGMSHEAVNSGPDEIVKLLVSVPASINTKRPIMREPLHKDLRIDKKAFLRRILPDLTARMLQPLRLPLSIYDIDGEPVYTNREFPSFCRNHCHVEESEKNCCLYRERVVYTPPYYAEPSAFICQYGLSLYVLAISCDGELLGYLKAGHIRTAPATVECRQEDLPYNVPDSTVWGILQILERVSGSVCGRYRTQRMMADLESSQKELQDRQISEEQLRNSLKTSQNKAFNLRINQHFLFNTLNVMMSMAIREGAEQTYEAIGNLAQLLQYTLRSDSNFVSLQEEVQYLRNYITLQKMRFGRRLAVKFDVDPTLLKQRVPFNFLQPIVENCFKHGFHGKADQMELRITICARDGFLVAQVRDNGWGMDEATLAKIRQIAKNGVASHGTAMVTRKLDAFYGDYRYQIDSDGMGVCVTVELPREETAS